MIDYKKVLILVSTISLILNILYIYKVGISGRRCLDIYIEAKLNYLQEVSARVNITDTFAAQYLKKDLGKITTNDVEEMIYSDSFVDEYDLKTARDTVANQSKTYNKIKREEQVLFRVLCVLMIAMIGISVGNAILNIRN